MKYWIVHYTYKNGDDGTLLVVAATAWAAKQVCHYKIADLDLTLTYAEEMEK